MMNVTSQPCAASLALVPPAPNSLSSGCAPITSARLLSVDSVIVVLAYAMLNTARLQGGEWITPGAITRPHIILLRYARWGCITPAQPLRQRSHADERDAVPYLHCP